MFDMVSTYLAAFQLPLRTAIFNRYLKLMVLAILSYFSEVADFENLLCLVVVCVAIISFYFSKAKIIFS